MRLILALIVAASSTTVDDVDEDVTAPVTLDGVTLFVVRGLSALPAETRAKKIADRLENVARDSAIDPAAIRVVETSAASEILGGTHRVMLVSDADADLERVPRHVFATAVRDNVAAAVTRYRAERQPGAIRHSLIYTLLIAASLLGFLALLALLGRRLDAVMEARIHKRIRDVQIESFKLIDAELIWRVIRGTLHTIGGLVALLAVFVALGVALSRFPWTRAVSNSLLDWSVGPVSAMGRGAAQAIPGLVFLVILTVAIRAVLKIARVFFDAVGREAVHLKGFDPHWATPTYELLRTALIAFALVAAYPYIPGSGSEAFKAITIFTGIVFSLGSSSVVSSILAGYVMTYRRTFRIGDRIQFGDILGDVQEVGLMVTRVRTIWNEEAVIPNSSILAAHVLNYSAYSRTEGLILHARVGIGYEVPWRQVESMLLLAAERTPGLQREPRPFVLQRKLADFCIEYDLSVYCADAKAMLPLYTGLHRQIIDVFNEYGVQIMTPAYQFDPAEPKLVPRDQWHAPPAAGAK